MKASVKKSLAVAGVASGIVLAGIAGTGMVSAATDAGSANGSGNGVSNLVDKIASKFNLNKADVQAVFDEERAAREAEHQQRMGDRLTQAVKDGKITEDQKAKILAKLKEIKADMDANRDTMKDETAAERKAAMEAKRAELEKWASDNNISLEYLRMGMGHHGHGGHGGPGMGMGGPRDNAQNNNGSGSSSIQSN